MLLRPSYSDGAIFRQRGRCNPMDAICMPSLSFGGWNTCHATRSEQTGDQKAQTESTLAIPHGSNSSPTRATLQQLRTTLIPGSVEPESLECSQQPPQSHCSKTPRRMKSRQFGEDVSDFFAFQILEAININYPPSPQNHHRDREQTCLSVFLDTLSLPIGSPHLITGSMDFQSIVTLHVF